MVLNQLGDSIVRTISQLNSTQKIDEEFLQSFLQQIVQAFREADVGNKVLMDFILRFKKKVQLKKIPKGFNVRRIIEREVITSILQAFDPGVKPFQPIKSKKSVVIMLVGLQGSGKTTTAAKLAYFYKLRQWTTALVCADTFRAGAREQLIQNAQQIRVPYYADFRNQDPVSNAVAGVQYFREKKTQMIIVDTSGRHMQEDSLFEEMQQIEEAIKPDDVIFVIDGTIGQAADPQARAFAAAVTIGSIIVTKLDSTAKGGGALTAVASAKAPISFYGCGEGLGALEIFDPRIFVTRMLNLRSVDSSSPQRIETGDMTRQNMLLRSHVFNGYNFKDMYEQYKNYIDTHTSESVMESVTSGPDKGRDMLKVFKLYLIIIDSMTDDELVNPGLFLRDEWRIERVARGAGTTIENVRVIIQSQKMWEKVYEKMSRTRIAQHVKANGSARDISQKAFIDEVNSFIRYQLDQETLKNLGGPEGVHNLFRNAFIDQP